MKKRWIVALAALCLALPAAGDAQGLPEFLSAVGEGVGEGVAQSAAKIAASMEAELGLALAADDTRIEDGQTLTLSITAENPRTTQTAVTFALELPERLACAQTTQWEAVLPPAQADESGEIVPSVTVFERTVTLKSGGVSEDAEIVCEMSMGTRFYRARQALALCVADVEVTAELSGAQDGRLEPGDAFAWTISVSNAGTAAQDVELQLVLPDGASLAQAVPGFTVEGNRLSGVVRAQAAQEGASLATVEVNMQVDEAALEGDSDALRLLAGALYADGARVPLPRIQVCGAKISAQLLAEADELEIGEETTLRVMVINEGLAGADMALTCVLPDGLEMIGEEAQQEKMAGKEATPAETALLSDDEGGAAGPDGVPALAQSAPAEGVACEGNTVVYTWHMAGATEDEDGVSASTQVFEMRVRAVQPQQNLKENLVGASMAYRVDDGDTQLGEAVALRVYTPTFMGITRDDWTAIFWASVLLLVTVGCLYAAVRSDKGEDYCCCE